MASQLRDFITDALDRPFIWGKDDCSLWLADWWLDQHGVDPAANLRGTYSTEEEKAAIVDKAGGLRRLITGIAASVGAKRTGWPASGDFGIVLIGDKMYGAINTCGAWAVRAETGVIITKAAKVVVAWSITVGEQNAAMRASSELHLNSPWMVPTEINSNGARQWLAPSPAYARDPLSVGIAVLVNLGYTGAITTFGATLVGAAVLGAVGLGLSLVSNALFSPQQQTATASDRQVTVRQTIGARVRFYGRVKVGGTLFFFETREGILYSGITLNEGQIASVNEIWFNDLSVTTDSNGFVVTEPFFNGGAPFARVVVQYGLSSQAAHGLLVDAFPGQYTTSHRLRGVANVLTLFQEVPADRIAEVYPQLNPNVRIVMNASIVTSVRTDARIWSDNPADCIFDYLTAKDDAGFPYGAGFPTSIIDLDTFASFADLCDELVPVKLGGELNRYNLWGGYGLNEETRAVLPRMLATCDGDLYLTGEGKIAIRGGKWVAPILTLDSNLGHIITAQFTRGSPALTAFNELTITYVEPSLDYQEVEGQRWLDESNISLRGKVVPKRIDLPMVPSHPQARRLAKIAMHKGNPKWSGRVITNFYGFNAINEQTVHIKYPPLGIDETFLIRSVRINDDFTGTEIALSSLGPSAYEWDPDLEEGTGPSDPPDTTQTLDLPPPDNINVSVASRSGEPYLAVTWTEPSRTALSQDVEYQLSPAGPWISMSVGDGIGFAESANVVSGSVYNVRVRTRSPAGATGDWSTNITKTATADTSTPSPVTGLLVDDGNTVVMNWTASISLNSIGCRVLRNTTNNSGTAVSIYTVYCSPLTAQIFTDDPIAGTYYYWVEAFNGSGGVSTLVASGAQIVT